MICAPCSWASARIRDASCLASASCARYCSSSSLASAWASSDRLRPPSIRSVRSASVFWILGMSILPRIPNTTTKQMTPMTSSAPDGMSGSCPDDESARKNMVRPPPPKSVLEDEGGHEADEGERLGQREADPHVQRDASGRLGLAGHRLDGVAEDQADADARADGGQTIADGTDVDLQDLGIGRGGGESCGKRHRVQSFTCRTGGSSPRVGRGSRGGG